MPSRTRTAWDAELRGKEQPVGGPHCSFRSQWDCTCHHDAGVCPRKPGVAGMAGASAGSLGRSQGRGRGSSREELSFSNSEARARGSRAVLVFSHPQPVGCHLCNTRTPRPRNVKLPEASPCWLPVLLTSTERSPATHSQECWRGADLGVGHSVHLPCKPAAQPRQDPRGVWLHPAEPLPCPHLWLLSSGTPVGAGGSHLCAGWTQLHLST